MLKLNGHVIDFKSFPNSETFADIPKTGNYAPLNDRKDGANIIDFKFENDCDIFNLIRLKGFIDDNTFPGTLCILNMPYIPYSRMDRDEEERLFSLKYFAKLINSLNFSRIYVMEPHSDVSAALFNCIHVENMSMKLTMEAMRDSLGLSGEAWITDHVGSSTSYDFTIEGLFRRAEDAGIYLVFPDAGAEKRYSKQIKYPNIITCSKRRDFNTGRITSLVVNDVDSVKNCRTAIIVDDLVSKGTSFKFASQALHQEFLSLDDVILCVTHCENTIYDGDLITGNDIQKIYTTNSLITTPAGVHDKLVIKDIFGKGE